MADRTKQVIVIGAGIVGISKALWLHGDVRGLRGAYVGFGHHHVGLTGGPKTGRLLAQLVSGQQANIDLSPYSPARFAAD